MRLPLLLFLVLGLPAFGEGTIRSHRGNNFLESEHCLGSYTAISKCTPGIALVELDVHLSSDGVPVCIHDATVDRTTNGTGTVVSKTLATLKALAIDEYATPVGQVIPTLEEALNLWKPFRTKIMIEPKVTAAELPIEAIIAKTGFPLGRIVILSDGTVALPAQYRLTTLRVCPLIKISGGSPTSVGAPGLATLRADGWDGISWQAFTATQTDADMMATAGMSGGYGTDERLTTVSTWTTRFNEGVNWALTDDAATRVITLDDTAWSAWATANGADTAIANRTADPDADGFTNFEECIFGTSPTADSIPAAPYGYAVRYSGTGTQRRAALTARTKPGVVSWEFWWLRAEESPDGTTWTAVPSGRVTENNTLWPADPTWRLEVDLGAVAATTRVRMQPQLFPRP